LWEEEEIEIFSSIGMHKVETMLGKEEEEEEEGSLLSRLKTLL
jgi:hypothetical protein